MRRRTQYAPRLGTITIALVLVLAGVLLTFGPLLGAAGDTYGVYVLVAATVVLLLGIFFEGI
jgi:low affinity Fe/Cu permease